jgi:glutathione S-transferase
MFPSMKLELISFKLCPFVQRSVITLNYKDIPYKITYIDLDHPPEWFNKLSPLGKVPVLKVDDHTALFESAVINEFIDETHGPSLHSKDPLKKAFERAWIEYGSELLTSLYQLTLETSHKNMEDLRAEFFQDLVRLESVVSSEGPHFRGKEFSLVDAAYAPLFMRTVLSKKLDQDPSLLQLSSVQNSVVPEFSDLYRSYCKEVGSLLY